MKGSPGRTRLGNPLLKAGTTRPLHGRGRELEVVQEGLDDALGSRVSATVIEGEGGIGKSALLLASIDRAEQKGFSVFLAQCSALDESRPFAAIWEAFADAPNLQGPELARIGNLLRSESEREAKGEQVVVDAFVDLIERVAETPTLLAVEDLHWSDLGTLLVIRAIHKRVRGLPLALFITLRPSPRRRPAALLLEEMTEAGARLVPLAPLSEDDSEKLVGQMLQAKVGDSLKTQIAGAGGNPLFITELLGSLSSEGLIDVTDGIAEIQVSTLPPSLRLTILRRLSFLSEGTLDVLRLAAVLGPSFDPRNLAAFADRTVFDLLPILDEARQAGVLEEDGGELRFRHDLIREALYQEIPKSVLVGLHRDAAERLLKSGASAMDVAPHLALGAREGDLDAARSLRVAGVQTAEHSAEVGLGLLERALQIGSRDEALRIDILEGMVKPLTAVRRFEDALTTVRKLLESPLTDERESAARGQLLGLLDFLARWDEARDLAKSELERAESDSQRAQLLLILAHALWGLGEVPKAEIDEALELARRSGDLRLLSSATLSDAWFCYQSAEEQFDRAKEAMDLLRKAAASDPSVDERSVAGGLGSFSWIAAYADRFDECQRAIDEAMPILQRFPESLGYMRSLAYKRFLAGEWDEGMAEIEGLATALGWHEMEGFASHFYLLMLMYRGEQLDPIIETMRRQEVQVPEDLLRILTRARRNPAKHVDAVEKAWAEKKGLFGDAQLILIREVVRIAVAAGRKETAQAFAHSMEPHPLRPSSYAFLDYTRGLAEGNPDAVLAAVGELRKTPQRTNIAFALTDCGELLVRAGRRKEAEPLLAEALTLAETMGDTLDARRITASMRAAGLRPPRGPRSRADFGWDSITKAEEAIIGLVAEGLTNREIASRLFLSPYTVETHLKHVFTKTGVTSRAQLATEYTKRSE